MKKKLLVLFFALVLALSLFSLMAGAANEISEIGIENLRSPMAGSCPDYAADLIRTDLQFVEMPEKGSVNGIVWYEMQYVSGYQEAKLVRLKKTDRFEINKSYFVQIYVRADSDNAVFSDRAAASIYELACDTAGMSPKAASVRTVDGADSSVRVIETTYRCTRKSIVSVEITGLNLPKAGEHPDDDCNVLADGVYVNGKVTWTRKNGNSYEAFDYNDVFVEGETYKYSLWLRTDFENDYWFRTDANGENIADIMVNGILMGEENISDSGDIDYVRCVEYEYYVPLKIIRNIDIVGVSTPVAGREPDYDAFPKTAGYDIVGIIWINETLKTELISGGMKYVDAASQAKLTKGDGKTFEAGNEYKINVEVKPQEGYEIAYDYEEILDFAATINGKNANEGSGYRGENAGFDCNFGLPVLQTVFNIDVTGIDEPVAGQVPDYDAVCADKACYVKGISWADVTARDALIAGGMTYAEAAKQTVLTKGDGKSFVSGHTYSVNIEVETGKNYEIDYDYENILYFAATVNGNDANEGSGYRGENAGFSYTFEHTCTMKLVKKVDATCTAKGKSEYYKCTCGRISEDAAGKKLISNIDSWGIIAVKAHSYKTVVTKKASLSKNGKTVSKCSVCGAVKSGSEKTIYYPKSIKLSATSFIYNGKTQTPSVTVKDSKGKTISKDYYTVKYSSKKPKSIGKYSVTITFKGKYSGTKTLYFNILPSKTSKITPTCSTTEIKATWKSVTGASGYKVELLSSKGKVVKTATTTKTSYTFKKLSKVTTYKIRVTAYKTIDKKAVYSSVSTTITTSTSPAKVTLSKVTAGSKQATLTWKTVTGASGYQVMYSTSSKFKSAKTATVKSAKSKKTTIKKLTKGKKYYFKVRAYKTVDGKKIYGAWSAVKSVKVK